MQGFKKFLMQGDLVSVAVAFVIATAFGAVVKALVAIIMDLVGKVGGTPDFSNYKPGGVSVGAFLTALITFIILAAVVYFFVVKPYQAFRERFMKDPEAEPTEVELLAEIRDALHAQSGYTGPPQK